MAAAKARGGIWGGLQRAGLAAAGLATFARLYLLPVQRHDLPHDVRHATGLVTAAVQTLLAYAAPLGYTLFVWWFSTGVILYLDGLPRRTFKFTMAAFSGLAALGFVGLAASSSVATPAAAYCGFTCALLVWAWQEVASCSAW